MLKQTLKLSALAVASVLAVGCSSTVTKTDIVKEEIKIQEMQKQNQAKRIKEENRLMEKQLGSVPDWVLNPPRADDTGFYGVGVAKDKDLMLSTRKAQLIGTFEIARTMRSELSGEDTQTASDYRMVVNRFVDKVNVSGAEIIRQDVQVQNGEYQTYVLMRLSYDRYKELVELQATKEEAESLDEAYERLIKRVADDESAIQS